MPVFVYSAIIWLQITMLAIVNDDDMQLSSVLPSSATIFTIFMFMGEQYGALPDDKTQHINVEGFR